MLSGSLDFIKDSKILILSQIKKTPLKNIVTEKTTRIAVDVKSDSKMLGIVKKTHPTPKWRGSIKAIVTLCRSCNNDPIRIEVVSSIKNVG